MVFNSTLHQWMLLIWIYGYPNSKPWVLPPCTFRLFVNIICCADENAVARQYQQSKSSTKCRLSMVSNTPGACIRQTAKLELHTGAFSLQGTLSTCGTRRSHHKKCVVLDLNSIIVSDIPYTQKEKLCGERKNFAQGKMPILRWVVSKKKKWHSCDILMEVKVQKEGRVCERSRRQEQGTSQMGDRLDTSLSRAPCHSKKR